MMRPNKILVEGLLRGRRLIVGFLLLTGSASLIISGQNFIDTPPEKEPVKNESVLNVQAKLPSLAEATATPFPPRLPAKKIKVTETVTLPPSTIAATTPLSAPIPPPANETNITQLPTTGPSLTVGLSILGSQKMDVQLTPEANQCEVLSKALEQGKITSLDMRYDQTYKTYAVYKINGIGQENSVWWVYSVNGQEAPKGCSYIKANNGDEIEWKYLGS